MGMNEPIALQEGDGNECVNGHMKLMETNRESFFTNVSFFIEKKEKPLHSDISFAKILSMYI